MGLFIFALTFFSVVTVVKFGTAYYWNPYNPGRWMYYSNPLLIFDATSYSTHTANAASSWNYQSIEPSFSMSGLPANHNIGCVKSNYGATGWSAYCGNFYWYGYITDSNIQWNSYYMDDYSNDKRWSVCCHELGHSLGLNDSGTDPVLMNGYDSSRYDFYGIYSPRDDDVDGINDHYP